MDDYHAMPKHLWLRRKNSTSLYDHYCCLSAPEIYATPTCTCRVVLTFLPISHMYIPAMVEGYQGTSSCGVEASNCAVRSDLRMFPWKISRNHVPCLWERRWKGWKRCLRSLPCSINIAEHVIKGYTVNDTPCISFKIEHGSKFGESFVDDCGTAKTALSYKHADDNEERAFPYTPARKDGLSVVCYFSVSFSRRWFLVSKEGCSRGSLVVLPSLVLPRSVTRPFLIVFWV